MAAGCREGPRDRKAGVGGSRFAAGAGRVALALGLQTPGERTRLGCGRSRLAIANFYSVRPRIERQSVFGPGGQATRETHAPPGRETLARLPDSLRVTSHV